MYSSVIAILYETYFNFKHDMVACIQSLVVDSIVCIYLCIEDQSQGELNATTINGEITLHN